MRAASYIRIGQTKALNIDFTWLFQSTGIFVNFNALIEFHTLNIIIPTRFDVQSYQESPFEKSIFQSRASLIEAIKILLVAYQAWEIVQHIKSYRYFANIC